MRILTLLALSAAASGTLQVEKLGTVGRKVENRFFLADLSPRTVRGAQEDSGTLRALTYKEFGVTFLRTQNRMHWAPNLQRVGASSYLGIGSWMPVQHFNETEKGGEYLHHREGYLPGYPEVKVDAEYRFLADAPYFLFRSKMTVEKPLAVTLLRNNEMTMDPFFTHLAWPTKSGKHQLTTFDDRKPLIEKEPIAVNAPWLAFLNLDKGYGYGFVNLHYYASRELNPDIGISDGAGNGKYWSRHIVVSGTADLKPGDHFEELTAYVLFHCSKQDPLSEFMKLQKEIRSRYGSRKQ